VNMAYFSSCLSLYIRLRIVQFVTMLVHSNVQLVYVHQVDVEQIALVLPQPLQLPDACELTCNERI
jgi:hypothetical protein